MTLMLATLVALSAVPEADVYAVVVGYNGGLAATAQRPELSALRFADDDALRMARWFEPLAARVWVLTEPDSATRTNLNAAGIALPQAIAPTRTNLFSALDSLDAHLRARTSPRPAILYFFYAGHGLTGHLLLKPEGSEASALTGHELRARLASLPVERVDLFIDSCRSQSLFVERGSVGPDLTPEIDELENRSTRARFGVITATQSDHPAGEASDLQGGFFSHVLASGLAGAADVDGDERVSFGELAAFVAFNTERLTGQRPWFEAPGGDLRVAVVDLRGSAKLRLGPELEGRLRVVSTSGAPVFAEVNKAKGKDLSLTLPAGHYQVQQLSSANQARVASVEVVAAQVSDVPAFGQLGSLPHVADRGDVDWQSRSFQTPFPPEAVAALETGFVAGREPPSTRALTNAIDASFLLAPAPFGLPGTEQGAEVGARFHLGGLLLGARAAIRYSRYAAVSLLRYGFHAQVGWRWVLMRGRVGLTGSGLVGFKTIVMGSNGDALAPSVGANVRAEVSLSGRFSVWLDGRFEAAWVSLDGTRLPFAEPSLLLGVRSV